MTDINPSQQLDTMLDLYLEKHKVRDKFDGELELEVRFGTKSKNVITHNDRDNVVKRLLAAGFVPPSDKEYFLRVQLHSETQDISNIRTRISGINNVSKYCRGDSPIDVKGNNIADYEKKFRLRDNEEPVSPVDFDDFNFRVSLQMEKQLAYSSEEVSAVVNQDTWQNNVKTFRYINRCTYTSKEYPFNVDISIVKQSTNKAYRFNDSDVLKTPQKYEIEIEVDSSKVGENTNYTTKEEVGTALKKVIKIILAGLQSSNYPIPLSKQNLVIRDYMELLWGTKAKSQKVTPRSFVGPSSLTLQLQNVLRSGENSKITDILENYTVTDKQMAIANCYS